MRVCSARLCFGRVGLCMCVCSMYSMYVCMYVCMYVWHYDGQKIDLFSALPFEKLLLCVLYYLILEFKCLQSGFLHPAELYRRSNSCVFYLRPALEYCIMVYMPHLYAICNILCVAQWRSARLCEIDSTCSAVFFSITILPVYRQGGTNSKIKHANS